jgi:hypothetical protein
MKLTYLRSATSWNMSPERSAPLPSSPSRQRRTSTPKPPVVMRPPQAVNVLIGREDRVKAEFNRPFRKLRKPRRAKRFDYTAYRAGIDADIGTNTINEPTPLPEPH